jgi:hypothetical protein
VFSISVTVAEPDPRARIRSFPKDGAPSLGSEVGGLVTGGALVPPFDPPEPEPPLDPVLAPEPEPEPDPGPDPEAALPVLLVVSSKSYPYWVRNCPGLAGSGLMATSR